MTETELRRLVETAARVLTGRRVTFRFQAPVTSDFDGEAYSTKGGYFVNIRPELSDEQFLYVLCHELGHVKLGHPTDVNPHLAPGALKLTPYGEGLYKLSPGNREREEGAERLGKRWLNYAETHWRRFQGDTVLECQLKALCSYMDAEELETWVKRQEEKAINWRLCHERKGKVRR